MSSSELVAFQCDACGVRVTLSKERAEELGSAPKGWLSVVVRAVDAQAGKSTVLSPVDACSAACAERLILDFIPKIREKFAEP